MSKISVWPTFKKPNSAIVMMPKVGKLTAVSRKIFNVMLLTTQRQINALGDEGKTVEATHYFSALLSDLVDPIEVGSSNLTTVAKKALLEMRRTEVNWEAPDAHADVIWSNMSLLSEVKIVKTKNVLHAYWALPPGLLSVIGDPQRYTPLDITVLAQLKNYAAVALYEICVRYKNNPTGVTSENPLDWWVDALSHGGAKIDPKTKKPKLRLWSKFKNEHVLGAIEEINLKSDITVELMEKRTGRPVTSAQFKVRRKVVDRDNANSKPKLSLELALSADKLGISHNEILNLLKFGQHEGVLQLAMGRLQARMDRQDLQPVESKMAYLRSVLQEKNNTVDTPQHEKELKDKDVLPIPRKVPGPIALNHQETRRLQIRDEFICLGKEGQRRYAETAFGILQKMNVATSLITKKYAAGEWSTGILFSKMLEIYATEKHGPDWAVDAPVDSSNDG